jgi:hypothetical protein
MKYRVLFTVGATVQVEVEADNEEEAKEKAWEVAEAPCLCHSCADQVETGDLIEICSVEKED